MGAQPHQGIGGRDRPHVRVVEGVRPVTGLGHLFDPDDAILEKDVHRVQVTTVDLVVRLGDCHKSSISLSS